MRAQITAISCKDGICAEFITAYKSGQEPVTIDWDSSEISVEDGIYDGVHRGVQIDEKYATTELMRVISAYDSFVVEFQSYVGNEHDVGDPNQIRVLFSADDGSTIELPSEKIVAEDWI